MSQSFDCRIDFFSYRMLDGVDGDPRIQADVTYPPSMAATAISLAVKGMRGEPLEGFYQQQVPAKTILAAELVTKDNAEKYYEPDSIY